MVIRVGLSPAPQPSTVARRCWRRCEYCVTADPMCTRLGALFVAVLCFSAPGFAQEANESPAAAPLALEPVVVTATRLPQPLSGVPASVSVVEQLDIQGAQKTVGLEEAL